jgi:hypothetical protein
MHAHAETTTPFPARVQPLVPHAARAVSVDQFRLKVRISAADGAPISHLQHHSTTLVPNRS